MKAMQLPRFAGIDWKWLLIVAAIVAVQILVMLNLPSLHGESPTANITRVPYASAVSCRPDGCTVMTGLIEVGTRVLRSEDGNGCVRRTATLADSAALSAPIVESVRRESDGTLLARIQGYAQLPMPRVHSVDTPTPCPIVEKP